MITCEWLWPSCNMLFCIFVLEVSWPPHRAECSCRLLPPLLEEMQRALQLPSWLSKQLLVINGGFCISVWLDKLKLKVHHLVPSIRSHLCHPEASWKMDVISAFADIAHALNQPIRLDLVYIFLIHAPSLQFPCLKAPKDKSNAE